MQTHGSAASGQGSVAAIITCYNEGAYIGAAVRSVLAQTRADLIDRIVIADDGSAPETIAVLRDIEHWDSRISVLYGPGGAGLPAQRNRAIRSTQSAFFAILDGDDVWSEDKLERQWLMLRDDRVGLVYSKYYTFALDTANAHAAAVRDITAHENLSRAFFLTDPPIIPSTTLIRRSAFEACGGFDASIRIFEDTDLYLRLARVCRFAFVDAPLLYKRSHRGSITGARKDLMAHHALVALKAAAADPELLPLVPRRLAERARKLGNHYFLMGHPQDARPLLRFAVRLDPTNLRAWVSWFASGSLSRAVYAVMGSRWRQRRAAMGVLEPASEIGSAAQ